MTRVFVDRFLWAVLALTLLSLIVIGPLGNYPINDDWYYARPALALAAEGQMQILKGQAAWSFPQIVLGAGLIQLFGFSFELLRIFGMACLVLLATAFYLFQVRSGFERSRAFLSTLALIFFPPLFFNSHSFMTDLPFALLWLMAAWSWGILLQNPRIGSFFVSSLWLVTCIAQRQFGVLIPFFGCLVWFGLIVTKKRPPKEFFYPALSLIVAMATYWSCTFFWKEILHAPVIMNLPSFELKRTLSFLFEISVFSALLASPLILLNLSDLRTFLKLRSTFEKRLWIVFGLLLVLLFRDWVRDDRLMPFFGNQISKFGAFSTGDLFVGPMPFQFSHWILVGLTFFSVLMLFFFVVELRRRLVRTQLTDLTSIPMFVAGVCLFYLFTLPVLRDAVWDRYLIPGFFGPLILMSLPSEREPLNFKQKSLSGALLFVMFLLPSVLISEHFLRWSEVRWKTALWAVENGVKIEDVVGGHEWSWWREPRPSQIQTPTLTSNELSGLSVGVEFPDRRAEGILKRFPFHSWLGDGELILRKLDKGSP